MRKTLTAMAAAAVTLTLFAAPAAARDTIHYVTLPDAATFVDASRCNPAHAAYLPPVTPHVDYEIAVAPGADPSVDRYRVSAHTDSDLYRWVPGADPGPGWARVTRRLGEFYFTLPDYTPPCTAARTGHRHGR